MRYFKMLSVAAVALIAAMALTATASATQLTTSGEAVYTGEIKAESISGSVVLHGLVDISCDSGGWGSVKQHGASTTVTGPVENWAFSNCNQDVTINKPGALEVHTDAFGNGIITSSGTEITVVITSTGVTCTYTTNETVIGTLTDTDATKGNAILDADSSKVPRTGGSFFCGSSGELTGTYKITTPSTLYVD